MEFARIVGVLIALVGFVPSGRGAEAKPAEELAQLKKEARDALEHLDASIRPETPEPERKAALHRHYQRIAELARRAFVVAETHPDAPEAPEALVWILTGLGYSDEMRSVRDQVYDLLARRYLDKDVILPVVRIADGAVPAMSSHAEVFLRAAVRRSPNNRIRALACLTLGRCLFNLLINARDFKDPVRGGDLRAWYGPERVREIQERKPEDLKREAEALFDRTIREFGSLQPMGDAFPPLGQQARGALFRLRHLEPGCTLPEIVGEDIDGTPMKLADCRGKVILITFWASWCGPCMGMVPDEKALVDRMNGRPFVLVGVCGDEDRSRAREVAAQKGINWRSFWDGGANQGTAVRWGVEAWPTVYLVDAQGVIRYGGSRLRGAVLDKAVADLVAEVEEAEKGQ